METEREIQRKPQTIAVRCTIAVVAQNDRNGEEHWQSRLNREVFFHPKQRLNRHQSSFLLLTWYLPNDFPLSLSLSRLSIAFSQIQLDQPNTDTDTSKNREKPQVRRPICPKIDSCSNNQILGKIWVHSNAHRVFDDMTVKTTIHILLECNSFRANKLACREILIIPLSDNKYVFKGSKIVSNPFGKGKGC